MICLVCKYLLCLRKSATSYLFVVVIYGLLTVVGVWDSTILATVMAVLVSMLPYSCFSYDNMAKWELYGLALPLRRSQIVLARYLTVLLALAFSAVLCCLLSAKILFFYYPPKEVRIFYLMVLIVSRLCSFVLFRSASFRWFRPDSGWKNVPEKFGNLWIILFLCNVAGQFSTASCFQLFFVIGIIWN